MTRPIPIGLRDNLPLRLDKSINAAHSILVLWTAFDAGEGRNAVVDDHPNLRIGSRLAGKHCSWWLVRKYREDVQVGHTLEL